MVSLLVFTKSLDIFDTLYLLSKNYRYDLKMVDEESIQWEAEGNNAKLIIVDLDVCNDELLKNLRELTIREYIPIIGLYSEENDLKSDKLKFIKSFVQKKNINLALIDVINCFIDFKLQYDRMKKSNEAIDKINDEVDKLFRHHSYSVKKLIDNTFGTENFLENKPAEFIIFSVNDTDCTAELFELKGKLVKKSEYTLNKKEEKFLKHELSVETEMFFNSGDENYIHSFDYRLKLKDIIEEFGIKIDNYIAYATTDTAVMALNYNENLSKLDTKVIKTLCIDINMLKNVYKKIGELNGSFKYTIDALARAGEAADDDTGYHVKRVNEYARLTAELLGLKKDFVEKIAYSAQMHDVGKIHIPNNIINKNGPLTKEEFSVIKQHTVYGPMIIGDSPHLKMAKEISLSHHEKYDGTGYPEGLRGEQIPLSARIVALADIYDALRSERSYKPSFSHQKAMAIIMRGDGRVEPSHFDPKVLDVFIENNEKFDAIWNKFS
ncbi:HD domain-containing protein [Clostridium sp. 19966]|uniref:HD-GYP domain-containing protein n=1 Tax=Clostridium sp. 19966 TaxID=2768166 RepID=UPI0028DFD6FA|nr:HD domain-containing phosphohydrolase [Clostridium sp. 19966]MDT8718949.1 HD domain-containing protein [Clostridium sp. 19966]